MAKNEYFKNETNPVKLPWPADYTGMCQKLQREGCRAIGRMGGDDENLDRVIETLKILAWHAQAKLVEQKAVAVAAGITAVALREKVAAEAVERVARQERALEGQIAGLGARLAGLKARSA